MLTNILMANSGDQPQRGAATSAEGVKSNRNLSNAQSGDHFQISEQA
ncbi:hypothetical protein [Motiliproteus sp.]